MQDGRGAEDLRSAVGALWFEARPRVLERVAAIEDAVAALLGDALDDAERKRACSEAHKLAGALGTFGIAEGSVIARDLEARLESRPAKSDAPALARLVLDLRRAVEGGEEPEGHDEVGARVALAGLEGTRAGELLRVAEPYGWRITASREAPEPGGADVVLLSAAVPDLAGEVARQSAAGAAVAVLLDAAADRVALVRQGARRLLPAALPAAAVAAELAELDTDRRVPRATVLAVDDDPILLAIIDAAMRKAGHEIITVDDPADFWPALERCRPDLVMLDVQMPGTDGTELCRTLRADPRFRALPVLFLTAMTGPRQVAELFAAGADDYVPKPVDDAELAARVAGRLERTRQLRAAANEDEVTGLLLRGIAEPHLERLVAVGRRLHQPVAFAAVAVDGDPEDAALAHAAGALRRILGPADVGARWTGREMVVGMLGLDGHDARARLADLVEEARTAGGPSLSAGVAELPRDGEDAIVLAVAALDALAIAQREGGDRVVAAGAAGEPGEGAVDVALVEDDEVIAELILHALETRGYRTAWIRDGDEAAERLGGTRPRLRAGVVLLDWDLPARDGLTVLRGLAADGVLGTTKVVMLTMRASEREVLAALEVGATDHVAKPFSVAVLMQRVRRVLAR